MNGSLRKRAFRLLVVGQSFSLFGDLLMLLALGVFAKDLTGSSSQAALVLACVALPSLLVPLLGPVIDARPRRQILLATDACSACSIAVLLLVEDRHHLPWVYLVAFIYGLNMVTGACARNALLPTILESAQLGQANAILGTVQQILRLAAPLAGVVLYAEGGIHLVVAVDIGTFAISIAAQSLIREPRRTPRASEDGWRDLPAGGRQLVSTPLLRACAGSSLAFILAVGLCEALFFEVVDQGLQRPPEFIGTLGAAQGAGAVLAAAILTTVMRPGRELRLVSIGLCVMTLGVSLLMTAHLVVVVAGSLLFGMGLPVMVVCVTTVIQLNTADALQGRTFAAYEFLMGGPQFVAMGAGAALVVFVNYRIAFIAVILLLLGAAWLASRAPSEQWAESRSRRGAIGAEVIVDLHHGH